MSTPPDITWTDVVAVAPELANPKVAVPAQTAFLAVANVRITDLHFPDDKSDGTFPTLSLVRSYFVAHMATMGTYRGQGGPVVSESIGISSKSYAQPQMVYMFDSTAYGRTFSILVRLSSCVLGFSTGPDCP